MLDKREALRQEYVARINQVMDYIAANLDADLSLARLAAEASFSRFHFHRLFRAMVGETISDFIRRVRVERAAGMLATRPWQPITTVALDCGFSGSAAFARAFRERFGLSASAFRRTQSKNRKMPSKQRQDRAQFLCYNVTMTKKRMTSMEVTVKTLPEMNVAYVRNIGPYDKIGPAFDRLMQWAGPRGLIRFPETKLLGVYHDDPNITDPDKLRADACLTVPAGTATDGDIGSMTIPGGRYAVAKVEVRAGEFGKAWDELMRDWLPESGFQADDRPCFEIYLNNPEEHPEHKFIVEICEPVKPL
jgi:AraC family transcriptional regulator